ncbi:MAG: radical SAM protein [Deltaproteobacteria bacterium]|uniref:Radical SAM protein n=1 Tax=Candidatus Zymogenus saltonus TaxID=2844893 RepID=A0A9D8KEU0_9DELT|nr:radical SAM protein [Candidatus Zymogenus saltonus]
METDNIEKGVATCETSDPVDISYVPKIPKTPMSLFVSITSRCNQACKHCAVYSDDFSYGPDLTTDQWLDFIDEIERLKVLRVKISGGEPFVREDFYDILDALYGKPLRISLNTNATLIDKEGAERLTKYRRKMDDIMVSIDGATPGSHDLLRGIGAFEAALNGIEHLIRFGHDVSAYCTVTRLNFKELRAAAKLAGETGISSMKFNYLLYEGRGLKYMEELKLNALEVKGIVEELKKIRADYPFISGTFFEMDDIFEGIRNIKQYDLKDYDPDTHFLSGCGALRNQCAIRPDGWAVPCDRLPEITAGNILNTPLDIIWRESETFVEFRRRFSTPVTSLSTCKDCRYAPLCTAGCPASAYYTYGTMLARDPFCCYKLYSEELKDGVG